MVEKLLKPQQQKKTSKLSIIITLSPESFRSIGLPCFRISDYHLLPSLDTKLFSSMKAGDREIFVVYGSRLKFYSLR